MKTLKKERNNLASRLLKQKPSPFESIDLSTAKFIPPGMTRAFRNNRFTVMIYDNTLTTHGPATKALIQNHFDTPIQNHWSELQKIKNEIFGEQTTAIEYYPAEKDLIDQHNIYWLWVFPEGVLPLFK